MCATFVDNLILVSLNHGGQDYSYLYDGKGNVTSLLDDTQSVVADYTYDTFGNLMSSTGGVDQPYRFSTKRYDESLGMSYYGYRFYSPALGRWINRDPLGEAGGINLYGFVQNNPVNRIDPWGLNWLDFLSTIKDVYLGGKDASNDYYNPTEKWMMEIIEQTDYYGHNDPYSQRPKKTKPEDAIGDYADDTDPLVDELDYDNDEWPFLEFDGGFTTCP